MVPLKTQEKEGVEKRKRSRREGKKKKGIRKEKRKERRKSKNRGTKMWRKEGKEKWRKKEAETKKEWLFLRLNCDSLKLRDSTYVRRIRGVGMIFVLLRLRLSATGNY